MSHQSYRTTIFEYYEYLMPDDNETMMFLPYEAANNYLAMPEENCYQEQKLVCLFEWYQRPTFMQYEAEQNECQTLPDPGYEQELETVENVEPSSPPVAKPKTKQNHVYQAEQGYLVEEPASESSEEEEQEEQEQAEGQENTAQ